MSILLLSNNPILGGSARVFQSWLLQLRERNLKVVVVAQKPGAFPTWLLEQSFPLLMDSMPWPSRWRPWVSLYHAMRIARWARGHGVKLIHCNEHDLYPFVRVLRRLLRLPVVCGIHFSVSEPYIAWAFNRGKSAPDQLLWTSHKQQELCQTAVDPHLPASKQQVLYLGLSPEVWQPDERIRVEFRTKHGIRPDSLAVGMACALRPIKRVHELIQLIVDLSPRFPQVIGMLAGEAPPGNEEYRAQIVAQIERANLGDRLKWIGHLDEIQPFVQSLDIFVSTSEFETFGMSVCEAMACGKPVVAYKACSVEEILGETGLLAETGDYEMLRDQTEKFVKDEHLRNHMSKLARTRVLERFDPVKTFPQLEKIYRTLCPTL